MSMKPHLWSLPAIAVLLLATTTSIAQTGERVILDHATIVADPGEPSFVQYAIEELADYLKESTGTDVPVVASPDAGTAMRILVGTKTVRRMFPESIPAAALGEEGYALTTAVKDGTQYIIATGSAPRGTKLAMGMLMKAVQVEGKSAFVPASLEVLGKPAFARRGMHFNGWPLNYPYSFRSWREEDWRRYLDILAYQGVNLFYLWPFMEIMPLPLSPEDRAYLEECRRVIDYAQKKHGMEVWIMQCTNRVAKDRCGVADPRVRPYWRPTQEDLDPGKPEDLRAILASRAAMYRILDNADGVCNIDSDPGFYPGSPISDYVKVLQECRGLIDRYNIHGKDTKLINWILWGWGRKEKIQVKGLREHQQHALRALKEGLPQPLWFLTGVFPDNLPMCRDQGVIGQTVYLPYGTIEFEPAYPRTTVRIDTIRNMYKGPDARSPDIAGVMGNVQTPLLQFPNLYYFTSAWCDSDYLDRSEKDVMLELAGHLYPDHRQLLADCYLALKESDPAKVSTAAERLNDVLRDDKLGRLGLFNRKLFPDHRVVARSLHLQLRLLAARQCLLQCVTPSTSKAECARLLSDYFDAYLAWDTAHGWHAIWGWTGEKSWPLGANGPPTAIAKALRRVLVTDEDVNECFEQVAAGLSGKHDATIVEQGCIAPMKKAVKALPSPGR